MPKTRWLTEEEQRTWRAFLGASQLLLDRLEHDLQREAGLPHTYYEILVHLSEAPNRMLRMSELADRSLASRSRLSHAVDRLGQLGWIERIQCPEDKRGAYARLTDTGFGAIEKAAPGHVASVRAHLFDQLSPQQVKQLRDISEAVLKTLVSAES
ncbi:MAG TPA: MarR family transcriptional regulator [Chloroflexota bacterium]|nr:MarR family transcriptional regulator [Chloroflexota bacterium]